MLRCCGHAVLLFIGAAIILPGLMRPAAAQIPAGMLKSTLTEPTDAKARKTYATALEWKKQGHADFAYDAFLKADKQDSDHCTACLKSAYSAALDMGDQKKVEAVLRVWIPRADNDADRAALHYGLGVALQRQGIAGKKDQCLSQSCDEFKTTLSLDPQYAAAIYGMGVSLAHLHQDDAARSEFADYVKLSTAPPEIRQRAALYLKNVELARARMAPPFEVTTLDGQQISLDGLEGKVVLIDFWATWCGPCREALPHVRNIARKFQGQPLVVLSVSLDEDEAKWKDFVARNGMTWLQYRDGGFDGLLATKFSVQAIPATFTIDADGVLEDQHVGDADIEAKLKKLVTRAMEVQNEKAAPATAGQTAGTGN